MTYTFSVSQVELARDCQYKWGLRYLEGVKLPPHPSALKGIELHKVAEAYLRDGTPPPDNEIGRIFRAGMHYLPAPGSVDVEDEKHVPLAYSQFVLRRDFARGARRLGEDLLALVGDHKTTSNLDADYLLNERTILTNPQACLYSYPFYLDDTHVRALWVYYRTRGAPKAKKVEVVMDRAACEDTVAQLDEDTIPLSRLIRERPPVADLEKNYSSCHKYGGCPHRGVRCKVSTAQLFARKGNDPMSSILDRIKKLKEEKEKASTSQGSPEPSNTAPSGDNAAPSNPSGDLSDAEARDVAKDYLESQGRTVAAGFVNPPESEGKAALAEPPPDDGPAEPPPAEPPPAEPEKPKRGRPKKLTPEERAAVVAQATQHANQLGAQREAEKVSLSTPSNVLAEKMAASVAGSVISDMTSLGLIDSAIARAESAAPVLYLDCIPPWPNTNAYELYAAARAKLTMAGVEQDYRLVEFGKGRGLLAEALRAVLEERKPAAIVAESRSPEIADCIATLAEYVGEGQIVRGLR